METLTSLLFGLFCLGIILGSNFLFWRAEKWPVEGQTTFPVFAGKGCIAGLTGWTWMIPFMYLIGMDTPTGYTIALAGFYLLFLVPVIGMILTGLIWSIFKLSNKDPGVIARLLVGLSLGLILGAILGVVMALSDPYTARQSLSAMIFYFTILGSASGIMARRKFTTQDSQNSDEMAKC